FKVALKDFDGESQLKPALSKLGLAELDDFHAAVGYGKLTPQSLLSILVPEDELQEKPEGVVRRVVTRALRLGERGIKVRGMDDVMVALAKCCNPVRGEEIIGYISRGRGVSVHSINCPNVTQLMYDPERKIEVEWSSTRDGDSLFDVKLVLEVENRQGLLAKIVSTVADEKINIKNVEADAREISDAKIQIVLAVADRKLMERVMGRIKRIKGVRDVERVWR
ncbi:MAG: bifunctional (p)ppGpp synthetase/guanosine-3',5'-bis(diphosphate) 3'-pyrophosphohydrolase, partial [Gemmatimonadetes bacterium]|nr:bifunctional (p)ppGpp synthetase/guanosine-3',5'-bis(diphosphate) 3'-pyrophosphohydrolase [Gemmatimonadota bacterium]